MSDLSPQIEWLKHGLNSSAIDEKRFVEFMNIVFSDPREPVNQDYEDAKELIREVCGEQ